MRIILSDAGKKMDLILPTALIFSRLTVWLAMKLGRKYAGDVMKDIPPEALDALFAEMRRIKKKHGKWDLVQIESADGETVLIRL